MGDFIVLIACAIGLSFIIKKLFFKKKNGKDYELCAGCEGASCTSCDPITLKENLKKELHHPCCH